MKFIFVVLTIFSFLVFAGTAIESCSRSISFDQEIESHLKAAADAQTVETAQRQLDIAITNIEHRGLTSGKTGIFYSNEQTDIGVWYRNLKAAQTDLRRLSGNTDQLTQTNTLMRLRETLMDHVQSGEEVTTPKYISSYPNVFTYEIMPIIAMCLMCLFGFIAFSINERRYY